MVTRGAISPPHYGSPMGAFFFGSIRMSFCEPESAYEYARLKMQRKRACPYVSRPNGNAKGPASTFRGRQGRRYNGTVLERGLCFAPLLDGAGQTSGIKGKLSAFPQGFAARSVGAIMMNPNLTPLGAPICELGANIRIFTDAPAAQICYHRVRRGDT